MAAIAEDVAGRAEHASVAALAAELAELGRRSSSDPGLSGRLAELTARVEELGERLELGAGVPSGEGEPDPRVDALIARVAELAARQTADADLGERMATADERIRGLTAELAERPVGDPALEARVEETASRIDALAAALAERPQGNPALEARLTETAHRVDAVAAELAGRADAAGQAELSRLVAELAERPDGDPAVAERVHEIHARLEEVAARPLADPALAARVEELAALLEEATTQSQAETGADPRVDALQSTVADLTARIEAIGEMPTGEPVPADLEQRLAAAIHLSQSLTDQLHRATSSWDEAQRALEARIEWLAARMEADAPAAVVSAPAEGRSGKRRGGSADSDADVEKLRMAVERLMLDFADHRRAISATVPSRDLDERVRKLAEQVDDLNGAVTVSGNGGAAPSRGGGSIDRELANQVKVVLSRLEEVEASSAAGRDTMLARLERIMGTIDWRLQRLENPGS